MSCLGPQPLLVLSLVCACAATAWGQSLWVVDPAGAGDFSAVEPAVAAAAPGDTLWILPGDYGSVLLDKRLTFLADESLERPKLAALDVLGAESAQVQHLEIGALRLNQTGRVLIDDCRIGPGKFWPNLFGSFLVTGASDLLLCRSEVRGSYFGADGAPALLAEQGSIIQVVGSRILGPNVLASDLFKLSGYGGPALVLRSGAQAWVVDSDLIGGSGQDYGVGLGFQTGAGGSAASLQSGALLDLRGSSKNQLAGGLQNPGVPGLEDGAALFCAGGPNPATAVLGPVELKGGVATCAALTFESRSYLVPEPPSSENPLGRVLCFGPAGQAGLLATSFKFGLSSTPLVAETPLFLDQAALAELLPLVFNGADDPTSFSWMAPSGVLFAGLAYHVQLFELTAAGGMLGANSIAFLLQP
jgi:hypothetical protein